MYNYELLRGAKITSGKNPLPIPDPYPITEYDWNGSANTNIASWKELRVRLDQAAPLKVVYILPVQVTQTPLFGNGLDEVKTLVDNGQIEDNVLFIQPKFNTTPWYANHPTNPNINQEDCTVELFSLIKAKYNMFSQIETYLLGFSKSGYGSMLLTMNHPNEIDGIAIWDAPLALDSFITTDMADVFVTVEYLLANYQLNTILSSNNANLEGKDIFISGYNLWETLSVDFVNDLNTYPNINFTHDPNLDFPHKWSVDWVVPALSFLNGIIK